MRDGVLDSQLHQKIFNLVPENTSVLDLGCGNGKLLHALKTYKQCKVIGVEFDVKNVVQCIASKVTVLQLDLEAGLSIFDDHSFDFVLQINTLQVLRNAEKMLRDTARIGKSAIIAFPNFAWWRNRISVVNGIMPVNKTLPYNWYDTPNIRVGTFADFTTLAAECQLKVIDGFGLTGAREVRFLPNMLAETAIFKLTRML